MSSPFGFHAHKVVTGTQGDIDGHGRFKYAEVTSVVDTLFYPNAFGYNPDGSLANPRPSDGIPLKAGVTRIVPMGLYNFKADDEVTVVAYGA